MKRAGLRGAFWPSPDEEALVRACLLEGEAARRAWGWIGSGFDIDRATGEVLRLLPLLGSRLRALGVEAPILPRLRGLHRKSWTLNQVLTSRAAEIVRTLDAGGVPSLILKGCAIALTYYDDVGLRPMGDIDVLVPFEQAAVARDRLVAQGWRDETERMPGATVFRNTHAYELYAGPDVECDLHWSIGEHMLIGPDDDPTPLFWPPARELDVAGVRTLMLAPTDQLVHVILHGAQPGSLSRLQWVPDALMILRTAEIDWDRLEDLAIRIRATIRVSDALDYLSDPFAPGIVPPGFVARLRAYPVPRLERFEYAMATWEVGAGAGMFPATIATYVRETRGWAIGRRARLFPTFLQEVWELDSLAEVPGTALRKASRTLRSRRSQGFR